MATHLAALENTRRYPDLARYSDMTIRNYLGELRYLFSYYLDVNPTDLHSDLIIDYLLYLNSNDFERARVHPAF